MVRIEPARDRDLPALDAYLAKRTDTCMIMRSNLREVGLAWNVERCQAEYELAWRGDAVVGVAGLHNLRVDLRDNP